MATLAALLILLAPEARQPVGQGQWQTQRDPVARRVASLLAGVPLRFRYVTVVPLHARVPSEAGHGRAGTPTVLGEGIVGHSVWDSSHGYLRVVNPNSRLLLVTAGAVFARSNREFYVKRDGLVSAHFATLFPAFGLGDVVAAKPAGILPPLATGILLHGGVDLTRAVTGRWARHYGQERYTAVLRSNPVVEMARGLSRSCLPLNRETQFINP